MSFLFGDVKRQCHSHTDPSSKATLGGEGTTRRGTATRVHRQQRVGRDLVTEQQQQKPQHMYLSSWAMGPLARGLPAPGPSAMSESTKKASVDNMFFQVRSRPRHVPCEPQQPYSKTFGNKSSFLAAAAAKSLQSCPTLCDPTDGSPRGSPVPGILQARTLEWAASP